MSAGASLRSAASHPIPKLSCDKALDSRAAKQPGQGNLSQWHRNPDPVCQVGLWTKADSVTQFDDLRVQSVDDP